MLAAVADPLQRLRANSLGGAALAADINTGQPEGISPFRLDPSRLSIASVILSKLFL